MSFHHHGSSRDTIVYHITKDAGLTRKQAEAALDATLDAITQSLKEGRAVKLEGFGTFLSAKRSARVGRNPKTGQPVRIEGGKIPKFRPGTKLSKTIKTKS